MLKKTTLKTFSFRICRSKSAEKIRLGTVEIWLICLGMSKFCHILSLFYYKVIKHIFSRVLNHVCTNFCTVKFSNKGVRGVLVKCNQNRGSPGTWVYVRQNIEFYAVAWAGPNKNKKNKTDTTTTSTTTLKINRSTSRANGDKIR